MYGTGSLAMKENTTKFLAGLYLVLELICNCIWPAAAISLDVTNVTCASSSYLVEAPGSASSSYNVHWDGRMLPPGCRIGFNLTNSDVYQLCVTIEDFSLETCSFVMKYYEGSSTKVIKTINCGSMSKEYCSNSAELFIDFRVSHPTSSSVSFVVAADIKSDILAAIGCGLSLAGFAALFLTFVALRQKANRSGQFCFLWKCLDVCMPVKDPIISRPQNYPIATITTSGDQSRDETASDSTQVQRSHIIYPESSEYDPPPPYELPPPTYEEVFSPKFGGQINIHNT